MTDQQGRTFIIHYKTIEEDEAAGTDEELNDPLDPTATSQQQEAAPATNQQQQQQPAQPQQPQHQSPQQIIHDDAQREMINAFLSGVECLRGVSLTKSCITDLIYEFIFNHFNRFSRELDGGNMKFVWENKSRNITRF